MVCTHTLYNEAWAGNLPIGIMELPEAVKRKHYQSANPRENKKNFGKSIDLRPEIAAQRTEESHWEGDTVVGKCAGKEAVVFSLLEKKTENYMAFLIPGKTSDAVMAAMQMLKAEYTIWLSAYEMEQSLQVISRQNRLTVWSENCYAMSN